MFEERRKNKRAFWNPETYPLTAYQRDVWLAQAALPGAPFFNVGGYSKCTGTIDVPLLHASMVSAFDQNDALHLRVGEIAGELRQWIDRRGSQVAVVDMSHAADPERACIEWMQADFEVPLSFGLDSLSKLAIVRASETCIFTYIKLHHIVGDGWSCSKLSEQIFMRYAWALESRDRLARESVRQRHALRPRPSYLTFLETEAKYRESNDYRADLSFWSSELAGVEPVTLWGKRSAVRRSKKHTFRLDPALVARMRSAHGSLFPVVASAIAVYLGRIHGTDEVVLGVPFLNRRGPTERRMCGQFANTLPLRIGVAPSTTGRALVASVSKKVRAAIPHQRLALGEILRTVPSAEPMRSLFDVTLSYQRHEYAHEVPGMEITPCALDHGHEPSALAIAVREYERGGDVIVDFDFALDVFDEDFPIEAAEQHFSRILAGLVVEPDRELRTLSMQSAGERDWLVRTLNSTQAHHRLDVTLMDVFEERARSTPEALAVVSADRSLSYAELDAYAAAVAHVLRARGVEPDDRAAVALDRCPELLVGIFGVLKAGGAYVPIDPGYPRARIELMLEDSTAKVVLTRTDLLARLGAEDAADERYVCIDRLEMPADPAPLPARATAENLAYVLYTSGSTGQPKGAMIEHRSVLNRLAWMQSRYPIGPGTMLLQKTPISFDVSVWELFWWALEGASLTLLPPGAEKDPRQIARSIAANGVNVIHFVPSMLGPFLDLLEQEPEWVTRIDGCLKRVFASGEALSVVDATRFGRLLPNARLVNLYGPTEATVDVSYYDVPTEPGERVPIGRPVDNTQLYVVGAHGDIQPMGAPGELCIGGIQVGRGYLNRDELTKEKFVPDPFSADPTRRLYRTGDLARVLADGNIEYLGRIDGQVKIRGNRVELGEIQNRLAEMRGIRAAVVVDVMTPTRGVVLAAYYVGDEAFKVTALRAHLAATLPDYMIPSYFVRVDAIPLTPSGKADRKALPAPTVSRDAEETGTAARTAVERTLVEVWAKVLGVADVGIFDDFYALGGDSLLMLTACAEAQRRGVRVGLRDIMEAPTVAALAARLETDDLPEPPPPSLQLESAPFSLVPALERGRFAEAVDAFPATRLQLGMLYHSTEDEGSTLYKDVFRYRVRMPWDEAAFERSVWRLVARHAALRSSFDLAGSVPVQVVWPWLHESSGVLTVFDVRAWERERAEAHLERYVAEQHRFAYVLHRTPLFRFAVHVLPDELSITLSFHHAILDGLSVALLLGELLDHYLRQLRREPEKLATKDDETELVLRSYALAEEEALASSDARAFWRAHLEGSSVTAVAGDAPHEPVDAPAWVSTVVPIERDLDERLEATAKSENLPIKHLLLAAHCLMLAHLSGQSDVTTGVVTHGRPELPGGDRALGLFLNTLPFRVRCDDVSFAGLARALFKHEVASHAHRRYPVAAMQEDAGRPLFEAAFNYVSFHVLSSVAREIEVLGVEIVERTNFRLLVSAVRDPRDGALSVRFDGREVVSHRQLEHLAEVYVALLHMIADAPSTPVDLSLLTRVLHAPSPASNRRDRVDSLVDVAARITQSAREHADAVAVVHGSTRMTYAELDELATRGARRLAAAGVKRGSMVGIALGRSPWLVVTVLAVLKAGAACVPLDPSYPSQRIERMIELASPELILVDGDALRAGPERPRDPRYVTRQVLFGASDVLEEEPEAALLSDPAYVLFTSGSTGEPKGVVLPRRALANLAEWQGSIESGQSPSAPERAPRTLQFAPIGFDVSFQEITSTLSFGGTLVLVSEEERLDPSLLLDVIEENAVERIYLPYVALQQLAEMAVARDAFPSTLGIIVSSGEQLRVTAEIRELCRRTGALLENQYGPTETHVVTSYTMTGDPASWPALPPIGRAITGAHVFLLDAALRPVAPGGAGEIYVAGVCLADGYKNRPELTDERFSPHPASGARMYRTGDLGRMWPDGTIVCLGRADTQVKVRGFRVELAEIELAIVSLRDRFAGALVDAAVVDRRGADGHVALHAFLVGDASRIDPDVVLEELRALVPTYMVPSYVTCLPELPRTPSGKRDDGALRSMPVREGGRPTGGEPPKDDLEAELAEVWASVLGLEEVGVDEDFFALGGSSLTAMRLAAMLTKRRGSNVPVSAFATHRTVRKLAEHLRAAPSTGPRHLVPIREGARKPLFLVHPIGGNVLCYARLARHLPASRPVFGLQAPGMDAGTKPVASIEELARRYLAEIRSVQPRGPYLLGGWSFGGYVAFEIARQLEQEGEPVGQVLLLDSIVIDASRAEPVSEATLLSWFASELLWLRTGAPATLESVPEELPERGQLEWVRSRAIEAGVLPADAPLSVVRRLFDVFHAHWNAMLAYRPTSTKLDLTLLRATDPLPRVLVHAHRASGSMHDDPTNGWQRLTRRPVEVIAIPGDHLMMMEEPYIETLGLELTNVVDCYSGTYRAAPSVRPFAAAGLSERPFLAAAPAKGAR